MSTIDDIVSFLGGLGDTSAARQLAIREGLVEPNALEQISVLKGLKTKLGEKKVSRTFSVPSLKTTSQIQPPGSARRC
jgi:hypothetical protein